MDMRFAKTIERLQRIVVDGLEKIAIAHLYSQGVDDSELTNFELSLTLPSLIYEQEKINLWTMKMELIQKMDQLKVISKDWIYKNILNFSFEEAELQREALKDDAMMTFKLTNLETTGTEKSQEQQGMLGQQPPCGTGDCSIILDEEHMMELIKDTKAIKLEDIQEEEEDNEICLEEDVTFNFKLKEPHKCFKLPEQKINIV
jgi:hypothetical protein